MTDRDGGGRRSLRERLAAVRGGPRARRLAWAVPAVVLAVAGALLVASVVIDGDDEPTDEERLRTAVAKVVAPGGTPVAVDNDLGIRFKKPRKWTSEHREGALVLTSPDKAITLAITSPGERVDAAELREAAVATIEDSYEDVTEIAERPGVFGDRRVQTVELAARNAEGEPIRALVLAASGPERTYAATLFSGAQPSVARLAEARIVLRSIRFTGR